MRKIRIPMSLLEESHNPKRVEEDRSIAIEVCLLTVFEQHCPLCCVYRRSLLSTRFE